MEDERKITMIYKGGTSYIHIHPSFSDEFVSRLIIRMQTTLWSEPVPGIDEMGFVWCLVGNIIDKHYAGSVLGIKRGTKQFVPGAKVYCFPPLYGPDKMIVLGKPRKRGKLIKVVMPTKYIKNWRLQKVYDPFVMSEMVNNWGWTNSEEDKSTIEGMLDWLPEQTAPELPLTEEEKAIKETYTAKPGMHDPVAYCVDALQNGIHRERALEKAKVALEIWGNTDTAVTDLTEKELKELIKVQAIVIGTVASVYIWNNECIAAFELEKRFLFNKELWEESNKQVIDIYLMHLIIYKQTDRLNRIFKDAEFRDAFTEYEDVYLTYLNPKHLFKSNTGKFLNLVNRVNEYSTLLTGHKLM